MTEELHLVLQAVRADRADDFERFLVDVVEPAVRARRPDLDGRWRVMRASDRLDGAVTYAFMLQDGSLTEDWDLEVVLSGHYGDAEAGRLLSGWLETFAPVEAWLEAALSTGRESNQVVFTLRPVATA
jgi:hypothetical protein